MGSALIRVDNPVYPNLHVRVVNDYGYVFGVGVPAGPIHFGLDLKYISDGRRYSHGSKLHRRPRTQLWLIVSRPGAWAMVRTRVCRW